MNYKLVDLPILPDNLIGQCVEAVAEDKPFCRLNYGDPEFANSKWDIRQKEYPNGHLGFSKTEELYEYVKDRPGKFVNFSVHSVPNEVEQWVRDVVEPLIADKFKINSVEFFVIKDGTIAYPHIDSPHSVFNFMVDTGGDNVTTQFWSIKDEFKHLPTYPANIYPYERLDFVEEVTVKKHSWVWLKVSEMHSVANLDPAIPRIILQIDVSPV